MTANRDTLPIAAWLLGASILLAVAVRLGVLMWYWAANSPYAWTLSLVAT